MDQSDEDQGGSYLLLPTTTGGGAPPETASLAICSPSPTELPAYGAA